MFRISSTKMLICDMAGTTIQEKGIVYNSLYRTIKLIHPNLQKNDIKPFGGAKKREVIKYFVNKRKMDSPEVVINNLDSEFNYFLKKEYQNNPSVKLIHPNLWQGIFNLFPGLKGPILLELTIHLCDTNSFISSLDVSK